MSRSCHSATFSTAAWAFPRSTRARPQMRSLTIGLRLCGIALEPFCCPERNGSSASRTSVRWRWRISVASRSRPGAGERDRLQQRGVAVARDDLGRDRLGGEAQAREHARLEVGVGGRVRADGAAAARRPTPGRTRPARRWALRSASNAKPASLMPNVVGSAWTPCVRPTQTVSTCSRARSASAATRLARAGDDDLAGGADLERERGVEHVGRRQAEVDPAAGRAGARAEHVDERRDVVVGDRARAP